MSFAQDTDGDGISDFADLDTDNDGILDRDEGCLSAEEVVDDFQINGSAIALGSTEIQLTQAVNNQSGSAFSNTRIDFNNDFSFSFEVFLGNNDSGADGIGLIFHNDSRGPAAVGYSGAGLGVGDIRNGLVVEFDTYSQGSNINFGDTGEASLDHTSVWDSDTGDSNPIGGYAAPNYLIPNFNLGNIEDNAYHQVVILWNAATQTLSYTFDGTSVGAAIGDFPNLYFGGTNLVYFGFGAGTGGANNDQRVRNILISCTRDTDNDGTPDYMDLDSDQDGCPDAREAGHRQTVLGDNTIAGPYGANGLAQSVETDDTNSANANYTVALNGGTSVSMLSAITTACTDSDADGILDVDDLDDDNDGILDTEEANYNLGFSNVVDADNGVNATPEFVFNDNGDTNAVNVTASNGAYIISSNSNFINLAESRNTSVNPNQNGGVITMAFQKPMYNFRYYFDGLVASRLGNFTVTTADGVVHSNTDFNVSPPDMADFVGIAVNNGNFNKGVQAGGIHYIEDASGGGQAGGYISFPLQDKGVALDNGIIEVSFTFYNVTTGGSPYTMRTFVSGYWDRDTDGDSTQDYLDLDSDADGCLDAYEAGHMQYVQSNGRLYAPFGSNGLANTVETNDTNTAAMNYTLASISGTNDFQDVSISTVCVDSDGDGVYNGYDLDDDNDGILDTDEFCAGTQSNVANTGTATQSSTFNGNTADRAKDGNTGGAYGLGQITHTLQEDNPWWLLEFPTDTPMAQITIWNRTDCCAERLDDFVLEILGASDERLWAYHHTGGVVTNISVPVYRTGRKVRVSLVGENRILSLAEVQVFSCNNDLDGDGTVNQLDVNMDGDNCFDAQESGQGWRVNNNGSLSGPYGLNGLAHNVENNDTATAAINYTLRQTNTGIYDFQSSAVACADHDGDGVLDSVDLDDDNDGIKDADEFCANAQSNVAQTGTATQSSTFGNNVASRAIDGNTGGNYGLGQITHTNLETNPWWLLSFPEDVAIAKISIWNRTDCCADRLVDFVIEVLNASDEYIWSYQHSGGVATSVTVPIYVKGRKVRISLNGENRILQLAEVSVFSCNNDLDDDKAGNHMDLDADGDGCYDVREASFSDSNIDGYLGPNPVLVDADGLVSSGSDGYTNPLDGDTNGTQDFLEAGGPATINTQPAGVNVCPGCTATISVNSNDADSIQWQRYNGSIWENISNSGLFSGTTTQTLTINNVGSSEHNAQYRAVLRSLSYACDPITYSDPALLRLQVNTVISNRNITHRIGQL